MRVDSLAAAGIPTAGLSYSLTCTAEISTTAMPTFQWFQDRSLITVGDTRNIVVGGETTSPYTNTLTFSPIQQSHQGAYICQVTVDTVTVSSPSTVITVGGKDDIYSSNVLYCPSISAHSNGHPNTGPLSNGWSELLPHMYPDWRGLSDSNHLLPVHSRQSRTDWGGGGSVDHTLSDL